MNNKATSRLEFIAHHFQQFPDYCNWFVCVCVYEKENYCKYEVVMKVFDGNYFVTNEAQPGYSKILK